MITPPKGDYASVPLTPMGRQVADGWDPAKDEAAGEACRAFGAGGIMRQPTRLRIAWADENTLEIKTDSGEQTRFSTSSARRGRHGAELARPPVAE
jgi:hypothetical protein